MQIGLNLGVTKKEALSKWRREQESMWIMHG